MTQESTLYTICIPNTLVFVLHSYSSVMIKQTGSTVQDTTAADELFFVNEVKVVWAVE